MLHRPWLSFVVLLASCCQLYGNYWNGINFGKSVSIPSRRNLEELDWANGLSLVRVEEVSRDVLAHYREGTDSKLVPSYVKLSYRVKEVFAGSQNLMGKLVSATAHERAPRAEMPLFSECVPAPDDEGIWLVNYVDGTLVCLTVDMVGVRFPIYRSGAHRRVFESQHCSYDEVLEFVQKVKQTLDGKNLTREYWKRWIHSNNQYIAQWVVWELSRVGGKLTIDDMKEISSKPQKHPFVQTIADEYLLSADEQWSSSNERQVMVGRWLTLDRSKLSAILTKYCRNPMGKWAVQEYDLALFTAQVRRALSLQKPASREWLQLRNVLNDMAPIE